ncbi:hypothetical protein AGMMS49944_32150 [Spirochaetia bacterium]|nr:hypothetical protein AGMMS49944_32150 [Spirochaetia bacterium]
MDKKKSENEFAIIRLWLDDVELEDEIHYGVDADKAFRLCRENIEQSSKNDIIDWWIPDEAVAKIKRALNGEIF